MFEAFTTFVKLVLKCNLEPFQNTISTVNVSLSKSCTNEDVFKLEFALSTVFEVNGIEKINGVALFGIVLFITTDEFIQFELMKPSLAFIAQVQFSLYVKIFE